MVNRIEGRVYKIKGAEHYAFIRKTLTGLAKRAYNPLVQMDRDSLNLTGTYLSDGDAIVYSIHLNNNNKDARVGITPRNSPAFPRFLDYFLETTGVALDSVEFIDCPVRFRRRTD